MTNKSDRPDGDGLLPCPFCGSIPKVLDPTPGGLVRSRHVIYCADDDCIGPATTAEDFSDAVIQWNKRATPSPTRDSAEGAANCPHGNPLYVFCAYCQPSAPPKPAVRKALANELRDYFIKEHYGPDTKALILRAIAALAAPVPSPDGAGEACEAESIDVKPDYEAAARALGYQQIPSGTWFHPNQHPHFTELFKRAEDIFDRYFGAHWPSSAVAAEPVAWRWQHVNDRREPRPWHYEDAPWHGNEYMQAQPLYASPTVRGDKQ